MRRFGLNAKWDNVWVVFSPVTTLWYLRFLRVGFKHCFLILEDNGYFFIVDPLSSKIELMSFHILGDKLIKELENCDMKVVKAFINENVPSSWKFGIFTCVEVVKRILGISSLRVITPYQLYKYLLK
ncbi:hypothetical protein HDR60_01350 [bacterium]|nr:hypothetical protein [bacterium]